MDQHQRELRRAAAQAFFESLDQLQETLCLTDAETAIPAKDQIPTAIKVMDLSDEELDFEQAVADIDRFMQAQQPEPPTQLDR